MCWDVEPHHFGGFAIGNQALDQSGRSMLVPGR
jgi:hypothetical protein